MSKADGWAKTSHYEWDKSGPTFKAEIARLKGSYGYPFHWSVYGLPRAAFVGEDGRYRAIAKGSEATLANAKAKADAAISAHTA